MKKLLLSVLALALVAGSATCSAAEDNKSTPQSGNKPVAVISLGGYDRIMGDLDFLGAMAGNPGLSKNLEGAIQLFTQGQGLNGLDKKRPWGVVVSTDGSQFEPLVFLPVNSLKQLLDALAGLIGEAQEADDHTFELNVFGLKIVAKEQDGWAFIGMSSDALKNLPKDPTTLLDGLDKSYEVAVRLHVQNVPELYRAMLLDQLQMRIDTGAAQRDDESDAEFAGRKLGTEKLLGAIAKGVNEIDQLTLGWALDTSAKTTHIDLTFSGQEGTTLAKHVAAFKNGRSNFAGFLAPDAAASLNLTFAVQKDTASQFVIGLEALRTHVFSRIDQQEQLGDEGTKTLVKQIVGEIFDTVQSTLESGKLDAGATLKMGEKTLSFVAGSYVADPKVLEDALKKLNDLLKDEPKFSGIKFDAAKHEGIRFHTVSVSIPASDKLATVWGEKLNIVVGIGANSAYLAVGNDCLNLLKQSIDKSKADASKQVPPLQLNVSLAPIFEFIAAMSDDPQLDAIAEKLKGARGKDQARLVLMPQGNSLTIRLDAQEAVIELVARAIAASGAVVPGGLP